MERLTVSDALAYCSTVSITLIEHFQDLNSYNKGLVGTIRSVACIMKPLQLSCSDAPNCGVTYDRNWQR
jgi:hypothetical protein